MVRDVYVQLARKGLFMSTNIEARAWHADHKKAEWWGDPEQDPMGVLTSLVTLVRWMLSEEILDQNNLNFSVRGMLTTALVLVYKLRSEDNFLRRQRALITVLTHFLTPSEFEISNYAQIEDELERFESEIVLRYPLWTLVDCSPYTGFEFETWRQCEAGHISSREASLVMGSGYFHYHAAASNPMCDTLETMGTKLTSDQIGQALALVGVTTVWLLRRPDPRVPGWYSDAVVDAAYQFVATSCTRSADLGVRTGAYADTQHVVFPMVAPETLRRLLVSLSRAKMRG